MKIYVNTIKKQAKLFLLLPDSRNLYKRTLSQSKNQPEFTRIGLRNEAILGKI